MSKAEPEQWAVRQHLRKYPKCEWICLHTNQHNLGEQRMDSKVENDIRITKDGDMFCAVYQPTFVNLQESPVGFGKTEQEALRSLILDQAKHLREEDSDE